MECVKRVVACSMTNVTTIHCCSSSYVRTWNPTTPHLLFHGIHCWFNCVFIVLLFNNFVSVIWPKMAISQRHRPRTFDLIAVFVMQKQYPKCSCSVVLHRSKFFINHHRIQIGKFLYNQSIHKYCKNILGFFLSLVPTNS